MIIEGHEYNLRLDLTAFADFEKETGKSILQILSDIMRTGALGQQVVITNKETTAEEQAQLQSIIGLDLLQKIIKETDLCVGDIQVLLWAAIGGKDSGLSIREAGRLLNTHNFAEVGGALVEALMEALPSGGGGEPVADGDDPTTSPTG